MDFNIGSVKALDPGCIQEYTKDIARVKLKVWIQQEQRTIIISQLKSVNPLGGNLWENYDALFKFSNSL